MRWSAQAAISLIAACASSRTENARPDAASLDPFAAAAHCTSGDVRDPNESEGPEMMPGHACIRCHAQENAGSGENDAPNFAFAGTVFPSAHEPDDCVASGAEGALVVVSDAAGQIFRASASHSGNFFIEAPELKLPLRAKVLFHGRSREMVGARDSGDCNACHSGAGEGGATGRIILP